MNSSKIELLAENGIHQSGHAPIHGLVNAQRDFFRTGATTPLAFRLTQLRKLRDVLRAESVALTNAIRADLRRSREWSVVLELSGIFGELNYAIANLEEWSAPTYVQRTSLTALDTPYTVKEPKGVVLIIGPWNYPVSLLLVPLISAIAAGNTVVLKPSEIASNTAKEVARIFRKNFEEHYLAVVEGGPAEVRTLLDERFDHIMFTGSSVVGRKIMEAATKFLTPVTLELGGKCPAIVMPDADLEITARRVAWGKWMNCGQTCVAPDYVILVSAPGDELKKKLITKLAASLFTFYGKRVDRSPDYCRIINEYHFDRLAALLDATNAKVVLQNGELNRKDLFVPPTILDVDDVQNDAIMQNEIFGPILPIVTVSSVADALAIIRAKEEPLALYLFTRDDAIVRKTVESTKSGSVTVNDVVVQLTVDTLPFGGVGKSGMGRYKGKFGFDEFSHEKAVLKRGFFGDGLLSMRYPPIDAKKLARLKLLTGVRLAIPPRATKVFWCVCYILFGILVGLLLSRFTQIDERI